MRIAALEAHFRAVENTRMRDVPILNTALRVEAVAFRAIEAGWLGVLVSPWFMNLVWLRSEQEETAAPDSLVLELPAGEYEFFRNHAPGTGVFYSCSLFSPVLQFEDQEAAVLTAQHVMLSLLDARMQEAAPVTARETRPVSCSRRDFLRGRVGRA